MQAREGGFGCWCEGGELRRGWEGEEVGVRWGAGILMLAKVLGFRFSF